MITLSYLKQMLAYNCHVVLHHLYMSLYIPRDKIECYWFVFRGKGTVGEYHLSKLGSSLRAEPIYSPIGRIAIRQRGNFVFTRNMSVSFQVNWKLCKLEQLADGYSYTRQLYTF